MGLTGERGCAGEPVAREGVPVEGEEGRGGGPEEAVRKGDVPRNGEIGPRFFSERSEVG